MVGLVDSTFEFDVVLAELRLEDFGVPAEFLLWLAGFGCQGQHRGVQFGVREYVVDDVFLVGDAQIYGVEGLCDGF